MKNNNIVIIVGLIIVACGIFYGGMIYGKTKVPAPVNAFANRMGQSGNFRGARGSGFVNGKVIAKDNTSITIELENQPVPGTNNAGSQGTKIVLYTTTTPVMKTISGSLADVAVGSTISITGTPNSDGSITAQSIQLRPQAQTNP